MRFWTINRMSLRPDFLWLTLNLALIIQCLLPNNIWFQFYIPLNKLPLTPSNVFLHLLLYSYSRLKTTALGVLCFVTLSCTLWLSSVLNGKNQVGYDLGTTEATTGDRGCKSRITETLIVFHENFLLRFNYPGGIHNFRNWCCHLYSSCSSAIKR
jgi:hypothetical protein